MQDDLSAPHPAPAQSRAATDYDLIVVGAGIAGLNALHAASLYLPAQSRVLLIDAKAKPGGMWTQTYDFVRLHQPYTLFTVGALRWKLRKPAPYLAARDEVQTHLASCLATLRETLQMDTAFEHTAHDVTEIGHAGAWQAQVVHHPNGQPDQARTVTAARVIHAAGFDVALAEPISFASRTVVSTTPAALRQTLAGHPEAPVYVVGGGKTGMDTILAIQAENPNRPVTLINGSGTYFWNRTRFFPTGLRRWFGGALPAKIFQDCALFYDGHNEDALRARFIAKYATNKDPRARNFFYGILSEDEDNRIEAGLKDKIWDYLADVRDGPDGPVIQLRSGAEMSVPAGSIFVNCTGSLLRDTPAGATMPCLSANDVILSIHTRETIHFLTSYASFVLSHLFFAGKLRGAGLYFLDLDALYAADKQAMVAVTFVQSYHNILVGFNSLPPAMLRHFGVDFNLWYPLPRRILALLRIRKTAQADVAQCRGVLDVVSARMGLGPGGLM